MRLHIQQQKPAGLLQHALPKIGRQEMAATIF